MKARIVGIVKAASRAGILLSLLILLAAAEPGPLSAQGEEDVRPAGFNGDGYADLAIGVPYEDAGDVLGVGAAHVLYGSDGGLSAVGDQLWHQDSPDIEDVAEAGDEFGDSLAANGDFNGDGYADLAVGAPWESFEGIDVAYAGVVNVLYGSASGLSSAGNQLWHQNQPLIEGDVESTDWFGWAVAAGDFDGDGYDDLAVGVPSDDITGPGDEGAVNVLYGSEDGLVHIGNQVWHQDQPGIADQVEGSDFLGAALAAGDFDGDGYDDLAVGVPSEDIDSILGAGAVNVLYGSANGLWHVGNQLWHQDQPGIAGVAQTYAHFGSSLAVDDLNGDGYDDLAVGVPFYDILDENAAGAVHVLYGSAGGLSSAGNQLWHQDQPDIGGVAQADARFGSSLAADDLNGDGYADLAVGVPYYDILAEDAAGAVNVLYGSASGLSSAGNQLWHQLQPGIADDPEADDRFGTAVAAGDLNGDGYADLAVGTPREDISSTRDAGAVHVLYGSSGGLSSAGSQFWHQDSAGVVGQVDTDLFGYSLAVLGRTEHLVYVHMPLVMR